MKKNFKRYSKLLTGILTLSLIMSFPAQTAFASDFTEPTEDIVITNPSENEESNDIPEYANVYTEEITLEPGESVSIGNNFGIAPYSYYGPETFTFQGTRRGKDHHMDGNEMAYEVKIKMADGSTNTSVPVDIQVRTYINIVLSHWRTFYPDGKTHKVDHIPFEGGGDCFFNYANISSGTMSGPVTITLTCYSW